MSTEGETRTGSSEAQRVVELLEKRDEMVRRARGVINRVGVAEEQRDALSRRRTSKDILLDRSVTDEGRERTSWARVSIHEHDRTRRFKSGILQRIAQAVKGFERKEFEITTFWNEGEGLVQEQHFVSHPPSKERPDLAASLILGVHNLEYNNSPDSLVAWAGETAKAGFEDFKSSLEVAAQAEPVLERIEQAVGLR